MCIKLLLAICLFFLNHSMCFAESLPSFHLKMLHHVLDKLQVHNKLHKETFSICYKKCGQSPCPLKFQRQIHNYSCTWVHGASLYVGPSGSNPGKSPLYHKENMKLKVYTSRWTMKFLASRSLDSICAAQNMWGGLLRHDNKWGAKDSLLKWIKLYKGVSGHMQSSFYLSIKQL